MATALPSNRRAIPASNPSGRPCRFRHRRRPRVRLELFLRNPDRVLTRSQIIERVWGADYVGDTKTLDVHVKRIRAKIEQQPSRPVLLTTVRGLGYKLVAG